MITYMLVITYYIEEEYFYGISGVDICHICVRYIIINMYIMNCIGCIHKYILYYMVCYP